MAGPLHRSTQAGDRGWSSTVKQSTHVAQLERFCNDVASEFLLTMASLPDIVRISTFDVTVKTISDIATCRKLSEK